MRAVCVGSTKDAEMSLRRELLFWSRLVRYHASTLTVVRALDVSRTKLRLLGQTGSTVTVARALEVSRIKPRVLGQVAVLALILVGGYLVGRVSAPSCAPLASAVCTEAQAQSPAEPTPAAWGRQVTVYVEPGLLPAPAVPPTFPVQPAAATQLPSAADLIPPPEKKAAERAVVLTNDEVREMQAWLKAFGFDPGPIDGYPGARTKAAIKRYQAARQTEETGQLDRSLLRKVRREAGHS
jgi:Putative peptidoglycan binding domain